MSALVLLTNGNFATIQVPATAQELASHWSHSSCFPSGIVLHKMLHLTNDITSKVLGPFYDTRATISLSLLRDARFGNVFVSSNAHECNYHEIPKSLDTQLFFGNILMILTLDGSTIIPLQQSQYQVILDADLSQELSQRSLSRSPSVNSSPLRKVMYSLSESEEVDFMDVSSEDYP